jgi:ubiquinone/menaquinone biosynthesis C-methylase UbiE
VVEPAVSDRFGRGLRNGPIGYTFVDDSARMTASTAGPRDRPKLGALSVVIPLGGDGLRRQTRSRLGAPSTELPTRANGDLDCSPDAAAVEGCLPLSFAIQPEASRRGWNGMRKEVMASHEEPVSTTDHEVAPAEAWDAIAAGYDEFVAPGEASLANVGLRLAGLQPGERFLDVAAGPGGMSLPAARLGAKVLATDWSPAMIARFEARLREEGLAEAEGCVMDAHALELDDDSFDVTGSQFGVMLVPDQPLALREMVRVTKPGGRVVLIAYGPPAEFETLQCFIAALQAVVPDFEGLPDDPPPLEFQVADPEVLRQRLTDAGLKNVAVDTTHAERVEFRSGQEMWNWVLGSNPIAGMIVGDLTDDQQATVRQVLDGMLRERTGGNGPAVLTASVNIGVGTK